MGQTSDTMRLTVGSTDPIYVRVWNEQDQALAMSGVSSAELHIKDGASAVTAILSLTTSAGTLSLGVGQVIGQMTQLQADALVSGKYVGQVKLQFTATSKWRRTKAFHVEISKAIA